jgi:hypothetical protein
MVLAVTETVVWRGWFVRESEKLICRSGLEGEVVVTMPARQSVVAQLARQDIELAQASAY